MTKHIIAPAIGDAFAGLQVGDNVLLSGTVYTARDAAHKKLVALIEAGTPLPFDIDGAAIYYSGPCPAPPGKPIGPCGPTTSYRMDAFAPALMDLGLKIMIGKGPRNEAVVRSMQKNGAIYLAATGGAAALLMDCVVSSEIVCFPELGAEAVRKITVRDMPLIVAQYDGESVYK